MEETNIDKGPEKRQFFRLNTTFPVMLKLYVRGRTGIITTLISGETVSISLDGRCIKLGLYDYIDITSLVEAAMNKIGVDVAVELIAGGVNFKAIGEIEWFKRQGENHLRIRMHFIGLNRDDRSIWNKVLLSLGEKAQIPIEA
ncbi:MAG: hypothetical protein JSW70_10250 [Syntrophobacterales bacterium]|nr:MAG: hypothetical protein JSW70_10250 [Syntrophobacterales bacterium]